MKYSSLELGTIEAVFNKLGGLEGAQSFLRGDAEVVIKHTIDCDANPYVPDGWKVEEHIKGGKLRWNPDEVELYICDEQKGDHIQGKELLKLLRGKKVLNVCVLDYLLSNPELIPEEWKGKMVLFWGTIYRDSHGDLVVLALFWNGIRWTWTDFWLGNFVNDYHYPAALSCK